MKTKPKIRHLKAEHREWIIGQIAKRKKYKGIGGAFVRTFAEFAPLFDDHEIARTVANRCKDIKRYHRVEINNQRRKRVKAVETPRSNSSKIGRGVPGDPHKVIEREIWNTLHLLDAEASRLRQRDEYTVENIARIERIRKSLYERLDAIKKERLESSKALPASDGSWSSKRVDLSKYLAGGNRTPEDMARRKAIIKQGKEVLKELGAPFNMPSNPVMPLDVIYQSIHNAMYGMGKDEREAKERELRSKYPLVFPPDDPPRREHLNQDRVTVEAKRENSTDDTTDAVGQGDGVQKGQNGDLVTEKGKDSCHSPTEFSKGMSAVAIAVGTHEVHCPNGWVSRDGKRGTGYVKYFDETKSYDVYVWVLIDLTDDRYPLKPHPECEVPLPSPELPTSSDPELCRQTGYIPPNYEGVRGHQEEYAIARGCEEARRILGIEEWGVDLD